VSVEYPEDLFYSKEHEWARPSGKDRKVVQIGITRFAVEQLGDVTQVELPDEGDQVVKDEVFGTVESVKAVSDLFAPVTGKVLRVNSPLNDSPEYVNEDPYDEGWMIEVELGDPAQLDELMNAEAYQKFLAEEADG
jgi:glycine cleavage system H protein